MREECAAIGRDPGEIEITTGAAPSLDEVKRLQDQGVSRVVLPPPGFDMEGVRAGFEKIGDEIISKF